MLRRPFDRYVAPAVVVLPALWVGGCQPGAPVDVAGPVVEKIPITASSEEAVELFLQGRELAEQIRPADARAYFEQALEKDPKFALAYLALANSATSAQEFFDSVEQAVALAENVSEGERLMILGRDAGVRSDPAAQKNYYMRLVELYPEDERAHALLAGYHFGRQEFQAAIDHYRHATEVNSQYSSAYNLLGYAHRAAGSYEQAEHAFRRYIELIPGEPNPYDSYAELLLKVGRFEESIANYEKALELDPNFVFSFVGIGNNQILLGDFDKARATFEELEKVARNDGQRRTARFWRAASFVHQEAYAPAVEACREMLEIAESKDDWAAVSGDFYLIGMIQMEAGQTARARDSFEQGLAASERADVNDDVKEATRRNYIYRLARLALAERNAEDALRETERYADEVARRNIPGEVRTVHELQGRIALAEQDYESALWHFAEANQQDPRVLYQMARASRAAGQPEKARELAERAAHFNQLTMSFALVRGKAERLLAEL